MDKSNATRRIEKARTALILNRVRPSDAFFAVLAMRLALVETSACQTAATDGVSLFYNPVFIESLSEPELIGLLVHEIWHCALGHHVRRKWRDLKEWNQSCDFAANSEIVKSGYVLPSRALLDSKFDGMGAEEIHSVLFQPKPQEQKPSEDSDKSEEGDKGEDSSESDSDGQGTGADDSKGDDSGNGDAGEATGDESSDGGQEQGASAGNASSGSQGAGNGEGATGEESAMPDPGMCGGIIEPCTQSDKAAIAEHAAQWEMAVRQAVAIAKAANAGTLPGGLTSIAEHYAKARVDWREELRRFVDSNARKDSSWTRPNRRFAHTGLTLPGSVADGMEKLAVIIDTSGSIDLTALRSFEAELGAAFDDGGAATLAVAYAHVSVWANDEFQQGEEFKLRDKLATGGTSFADAMQWAEQQDATAIVYFTDLQCSEFGVEPSAPVLWATWGDSRAFLRLAERVPFGEAIHISAS